MDNIEEFKRVLGKLPRGQYLKCVVCGSEWHDYEMSFCDYCGGEMEKIKDEPTNPESKGDNIG